MLSRRQFLQGTLVSLCVPSLLKVAKVFGLDASEYGLPMYLGETNLASEFTNTLNTVPPTSVTVTSFSGRKTNLLDYFRK